MIRQSKIVDLKAKKFITKEDYNQMMKYLTLLNKELGLIVNFRSPYLKPKRVLNPKFHSEHSGADSGHSGRSRGFTLMEAIVAVSVFAVSTTSILGVYLAVQRLNQQSTSLQALQQNGRFITEDITKTIRNGQIDYTRYNNNVPQPFVSELYLVDRDNIKIRIYKQQANLVIEKTGIGSSNFTGKEVRVLNFQAYIWPAANPFPGATEHPAVTVYLDLESNINPRDIIRMPFQTTAATRQYPEQ